MARKRIGGSTVCFQNTPAIIGYASVAGKKEGEGPLSATFDYIEKDSFFGEKTWEKAESTMQKKALSLAMNKAKKEASNLNFVFGGDLLNQCIGTSFAMRGFNVPLIGLYGACSTMAESLMLASMSVDGGFADCCAALTSSHFCTAERQYRMPLEYGGQRSPTAQWTATGSGVCIVSAKGEGAKVTHATAGCIIDMGITDIDNMGAAMAPAAYETIRAFLSDTGTAPSDYDLILTGDLGKVGKNLLCELFKLDGVDIKPNYNDCGVILFDENQDVHAGGSGCGCSAIVLCGHVLNEMNKGKYKKVIFAGTGAMLSPISSFQGESVPGVCHLVCISA